jgi:hypothetical protein
MTVKNIPLRATKAPNLPIAPVDYNQQYIDQLANAFRLYFTQVDNFTQAAINPLYGPTTDRPVESIQAPIPIGQTYFDTDLGTTGLPIWWDGTQWINASGTAV